MWYLSENRCPLRHPSRQRYHVSPQGLPSGFIHFNFTPWGKNGDKATPSLVGNVTEGVFLDQKRIFWRYHSFKAWSCAKNSAFLSYILRKRLSGKATPEKAQTLSIFLGKRTLVGTCAQIGAEGPAAIHDTVVGLYTPLASLPQPSVLRCRILASYVPLR